VLDIKNNSKINIIDLLKRFYMFNYTRLGLIVLFHSSQVFSY